MTALIFFSSLMFVTCFMGFAVKPSPIYGGLGLIISGGVGCGLILGVGGSYLGLLVFLVYLGGMMVVFGYTTAMAAEDYPESWVSNVMMVSVMSCGFVMELVIFTWLTLGDGMDVVVGLSNMSNWVVLGSSEGEFMVGDTMGVASLYSLGSWLIAIAGWILFVSVLVVIEITRGA